MVSPYAEGHAVRRLLLALTFALGAPLTPAFARLAPVNSDGAGWQSLFTDTGWGPLVAVGIVIFIVVGGLLLRRILPSISEVAQDREGFWETMPADADGYKGVLFDDEILGGRWFAFGPFFAQRIRVELRNGDPAKSEELFHNKEQPNTVKPKLREEALALWIRTAETRKLPAVYTTQSRIFVLPAGYYAEALQDPKAFLKKLKPYAFKGKPLPEI